MTHAFPRRRSSDLMLAAFCLVLMVTPPRPARYAATASGVLLMLSLLWTYLHFMAYVTIWGADLPDEIAWVLPRTQTSWGWATAIGGLLQGQLAILALAIPAIRSEEQTSEPQSLMRISYAVFCLHKKNNNQ